MTCVHSLIYFLSVIYLKIYLIENTITPYSEKYLFILYISLFKNSIANG